MARRPTTKALAKLCKRSPGNPLCKSAPGGVKKQKGIRKRKSKSKRR